MGRQYTDALLFLFDGVVEYYRDTQGCHGDPQPSDLLYEKWGQWREEVVSAMFAWAEPLGLGDNIAQIIENEEYFEYDVYQTLAGAGVGIYDGRWDNYLSRDLIEERRGGKDSLQFYLAGKRTYDYRGSLGHAFAMIEQAIDEEVYEGCQGPKQKTFFDLNGADDPRQRMAQLLEGRAVYEVTFPDGSVKHMAWQELHVDLRASDPQLWKQVRYRPIYSSGGVNGVSQSAPARPLAAPASAPAVRSRLPSWMRRPR